MSRKLERLLDVLTDRTNDGRLAWDEVDENAFVTDVGGRLVRVFRGTREVDTGDGDTRLVTTYGVVVMNSSAKVIEDQVFIAGDPSFESAAELYRTARRAALNTDAVLDEMLNQLED